jgi:broad specificity phosphatase PhoE
MRRLLLVPHAATVATRAGAFPRGDEPLEPRGRAAAGALAELLPARCELLAGPARACAETAAAAGNGAAATDPALADCDWGGWAGRTLADVGAADPEAAEAWRTDPAARPHGGESLAALAVRVGGWLDGQARLDGAAVAITHAAVVRAALVSALGAPPEAFWRIDAAPLSVTELHAREGSWIVARVNAAPASAASATRRGGSEAESRGGDGRADDAPRADAAPASAARRGGSDARSRGGADDAPRATSGPATGGERERSTAAAQERVA